MRILCIDGPYFLGAFKGLGHQTLCLGTSGGVDVPLAAPLDARGLLDILEAKGFTPDVVLWSDTCQPPTVAGLEALPWPTMAYSIDQYLNPWHVAFSAAFDLALVAQSDYLPIFAREHPRPALWLPLFCDPAYDLDPGLPRDIPMSFVGTLDPPANPLRRNFLESLKRLVPLATLSGDYRPVFGRSRLALNQSAAGELNLRLFQAMACGAAVLTEDTGNGLRDLFTPGQHLMVYERNNPASAAAQALAALADPGLTDMAQAGRQEVLAKHTVDVRAQAILDQAENLLAAQVQEKRLADLPTARKRMATAYSVLALDERLPLPQDLRQYYLNLAMEMNT